MADTQHAALPSSPPATGALRNDVEDEKEDTVEVDSSSFLPPPPESIDESRRRASTGDYKDGDNGTGTGNGNDDGEGEGTLDSVDEEDSSFQNYTGGFEDTEMHRRLMDIESSFVPDPSTIEIGGDSAGADDTYVMGLNLSKHRLTKVKGSAGQLRETQSIPTSDNDNTMENEGVVDILEGTKDDADTRSIGSRSTKATIRAPSPADKPPVPELPEQLTVDARDEERASSDGHARDPEATPKRNRSLSRRSSSRMSDNRLSISSISDRRRERPKFLIGRQSANRLSTSSIATVRSEVTSSDATMGVDYALQSGGALPSTSQKRSSIYGHSKTDLSRSTSLGSMASGISDLSDEPPRGRRVFSNVSDANLHTLNEEEHSSLSNQDLSNTSTDQGDDERAPVTPKARRADASHALDTTATQRVLNFQTPGTSMKKYDDNFGLSTDRRPGQPTPGFGRGKNMTLKEQSSTIDRLSKENFDLKMRIHFLNQALNKRSEDGIKEMISENVELKSDKLKAQKEIQSLRRSIRELERQLKDLASPEGEKNPAYDEQDMKNGPIDEEELLYLRDRVEIYEVEIERLRAENISREGDKRRLSELVKSMNYERSAVGSETGAREERDMWKDMLEVETAAREQTEEENKRLREEILHLKSDAMYKGGRLHRMDSATSMAGSGYYDSAASGPTLVEVELLKQENAELRREVGAQTSMLTSRNREKERLYQEIEDLKLQRRQDGRSVAGDSIFERSASRTQGRSRSRASDSRISDSERDSLETKNGELRDQIATLKLENQSLRSQLEEYANEVDGLEKEYQEELNQAGDDLRNVESERDQALQMLEDREADLEDLRVEAQEELDAMMEEIDAKYGQCQRLEVEIVAQQENLTALQTEVRSANEGISRLEEDAQNNLQKYKSVQQDLEYTNQELETMEKDLVESNNKIQRLTVQQESSQNEIAFLREEQDGDKIRIGDLETELKSTETSLQIEKEKNHELDKRLAEERYQREVVGSKEKQDVQRIINDLNRECSASKEEIRKLKKNLSAREVEASTWKDRLNELENNLRETLGDLNGTKSSLLASITKLQKELESTALELESTRHKLDEKEGLLRKREELLESHGLETRKLADLLERERNAHRADKLSFEQSLKSHHQASRTINKNNSRITDLEGARNQDRKRYNSLEQQYKDQLNERNAMFLTLWKRLSAVCGPDWAHSNSLINGNLPSQEVIGNILFWPGFNKNLMLAVRTVEGLINGFKTKVKSIERDLSKQYQGLEQNLNIRIKKLDRLEDVVQQLRTHKPQASNVPNAELSKLKGENRLLKAELNLLQAHSRGKSSNTNNNAGCSPGYTGRGGVTSSPLSKGSAGSEAGKAPNQFRSDRSNSSHSRGSSHIPQPTRSSPTTNPASSAVVASSNTLTRQPSHSHSNSEPSQDRWIQRLRELERRLKAEREARLMDRSGARRRLEERNAENEELRAELERERMSRIISPSEAELVGNDGQQFHDETDKNKNDGRHQSRSGGEVVVIDHGYGRRSRSTSHARGNQGSDNYETEGNEEDNSSGTDDRGGLCVEVEV